MRIFVTGASGWVGLAVVRELMAAGHQVTGLVRSETGASALRQVGAEPLFGSLDDLAALRRGADAADGVIHTAFDHDFSKFAANCATDRRAIETLGSVLVGSTRPIIVSSGFGRMTPDRQVVESDRPPEPSDLYPRASEAAAEALAARGVHATSVRLAPTVHGHGDHGFVPRLIQWAREKGCSAYIDAGSNRWPAVHRLDAARVYRLAVEHGGLGGPFHAVAEEGIPFRQIADTIGAGLNVPVVSLSGKEAAAHFGWFTQFAGMHVPASSAITRERLGWSPAGPTLLEDLAGPEYFKTEA